MSKGHGSCLLFVPNATKSRTPHSHLDGYRRTKSLPLKYLTFLHNYIETGTRLATFYLVQRP
jgi:hypothetical protein